DDLCGGPADEDEDGEDDPGVLGAVGRCGVMVADHRQYGGHGEEGVVLAAHLDGGERGVVGGDACSDVGHDSAVRRDDTQPDVCGHQCAEQGADVDVCRAAVEDL